MVICAGRVVCFLKNTIYVPDFSFCDDKKCFQKSDNCLSLLVLFMLSNISKTETAHTFSALKNFQPRTYLLTVQE